MLNILKYERQRVDGEARLYKLSNPILQYEKEYPAVYFDIENQEDIDAIKTYYFNRYPNDRIAGYVLSFDKLQDYYTPLKNSVPTDTNPQFICTIPNEFFFYGGLKDNISSSYYNIKSLPDEVKHGIKEVITTKQPYEKIQNHKKLWLKIISNNTTLFKIVSAFVNPQITYGITILESIGNLLCDTNDIVTNTTCYDYAKKLYHTESRDIENDGKILCYPIHVHPNFLKRKSNIDELTHSINEIDPKGIIFKLVDIDDIRRRTEIIENYNYFIKNMKELSETLQIPSFYISARNEGLISLTRGIDAYSQPFNRSHNIPRDIKMEKGKMHQSWKENPKLSSGSIYNYRTKEMYSRQDFEKLILQNNNTINAPIGELANITIGEMQNMTPPRFRQYSKMYLMAIRNLEVQEIHDAIKEGNTRTFRSKFRYWLKDSSLFPQ